MRGTQEFARHDEEPDRRSRAYTGTDPRTGAPFECTVRHERFLAPEVFFRPDIVSEEYSTPLPQVGFRALCDGSVGGKFLPCSGVGCDVDVLAASQLVDRCIQSCPVDTRRALYGNIVLSVSLSRTLASTGVHCMPL